MGVWERRNIALKRFNGRTYKLKWKRIGILDNNLYHHFDEFSNLYLPTKKPLGM